MTKQLMMNPCDQKLKEFIEHLEKALDELSKDEWMWYYCLDCGEYFDRHSIFDHEVGHVLIFNDKGSDMDQSELAYKIIEWVVNRLKQILNGTNNEQ